MKIHVLSPNHFNHYHYNVIWEIVLTWSQRRKYTFSLTTVCLVFVMRPELLAFPLKIPGPGRITMKPHLKSAGPETPSPNENLVAKLFLAASVHTNITADQIDKGFIVTKMSKKSLPLADRHSVMKSSVVDTTCLPLYCLLIGKK